MHLVISSTLARNASFMALLCDANSDWRPRDVSFEAGLQCDASVFWRPCRVEAGNITSAKARRLRDRRSTVRIASVNQATPVEQRVVPMLFHKLENIEHMLGHLVASGNVGTCPDVMLGTTGVQQQTIVSTVLQHLRDNPSDAADGQRSFNVDATPFVPSRSDSSTFSVPHIDESVLSQQTLLRMRRCSDFEHPPDGLFGLVAKPRGAHGVQAKVDAFTRIDSGWFQMCPANFWENLYPKFFHTAPKVQVEGPDVADLLDGLTKSLDEDGHAPVFSKADFTTILKGLTAYAEGVIERETSFNFAKKSADKVLEATQSFESTSGSQSAELSKTQMQKIIDCVIEGINRKVEPLGVAIPLFRVDMEALLTLLYPERFEERAAHGTHAFAKQPANLTPAWTGLRVARRHDSVSSTLASTQNRHGGSSSSPGKKKKARPHNQGLQKGADGKHRTS